MVVNSISPPFLGLLMRMRLYFVGYKKRLQAIHTIQCEEQRWRSIRARCYLQYSLYANSLPSPNHRTVSVIIVHRISIGDGRFSGNRFSFYDRSLWHLLCTNRLYTKMNFNKTLNVKKLYDDSSGGTFAAVDGRAKCCVAKLIKSLHKNVNKFLTYF